MPLCRRRRIFATAVAAAAVLCAACGSGPRATTADLGAIRQPTPDPTLDAVVRDLPRVLAGVAAPSPTPTPVPVPPQRATPVAKPKPALPPPPAPTLPPPPAPTPAPTRAPTLAPTAKPTPRPVAPAATARSRP
ncbi:MAG TPA: hypothetical protein VKV73_10255 [Chloroflexota bacterium]|nr:hypothetical protein [Chloroflexota bacterium]